MSIALLLIMCKVYILQIKMLNNSELHFSSQQDVVITHPKVIMKIPNNVKNYYKLNVKPHVQYNKIYIKCKTLA